METFEMGGLETLLGTEVDLVLGTREKDPGKVGSHVVGETVGEGTRHFNEWRDIVGMEMECDVCGKQGKVFCFCKSVKTRLCKSCEPLHYKKLPKAKHQTFPISSYLYLEHPQDLDSFLERDRNVKQVLSAIDNAELRLTEECERVTMELESEETRIVQSVKETMENARVELMKLQGQAVSRLGELKSKVKSTMRSRVLDEKDEVHRMVQEPTAVWTFLNEFNLQVHFKTDDLNDILENYCHCYATGNHSTDFSSTQDLFWSETDHIPRIFTINPSFRTIGIYNPERKTFCQHLISSNVSLYEYSSWCLMENSELAICGGYNDQKGRCTRSALVINSLTTVARKLPQMLQARRRGGLIYLQGDLWMFGGYSSDYLNQVERFEFQAQSWKKIGYMLEAKSAICPVSYGGDKVLLAGDGSKSIESFSLSTLKFSPLKLRLSFDSWPTLFLQNSQILVLQRSSLVVFTDKGSGNYSKQVVDIHCDNWWYSQSQPVSHQGKFYFLRYK